MALTPYTLHNFVDDSEPDINALHLNEIDQGIKNAIDGVNGILNALSNQIEDNPAKFASSAALYAVNGTLSTVSTNLGALQGTVSTLNSNLDNKFNSADIILRTYTIPSATYTSGKGAIQIPGFTSVPSGYAVFGSYTDTGQSATMIADLNTISGSNAYLSYYSSAQVTTSIIVKIMLIKNP